MIRLADRKDCCGCGACAAVCPHGAITMVPDGMGFCYPRVDMDRCVDCHRCEDVCAFATNRSGKGVRQACRPHRTEGGGTQFAHELSTAEPLCPEVKGEVMAEAIRFPALMDRSQSGGLAFALMRKAVRGGMVVYGAAIDADFAVRHRRVEREEELEPLRLSKYVQSELDPLPVLEDLKAGRRVLFTGTPCQCAGVGSLCRKYRDRLLLADILCHGVPAPSVWRDYLAEQQRRQGKKLTRVLFRDPSLGWHEHKEALFFGDEKRVSGEFTELFYRHLMLRPSCTVCPFASVQRVSDLTMADCWGVEKALPGFADDNRGCSLLLCNTPEGKAFAADFPAERVERRPVALEKVMQANFLAPSTPKDGADLFENTYLRRGYSVALRRCRPGAIGIRLRRWARKAGIKL